MFKKTNKPQPPEPETIYVPPVSNREFVRVWMNSRSLKEVTEELQITKQVASVRATTLRKKGVNLPMMFELHDPNSVEELNKLIDEYKKGAK